jgi:malonyl-CoA O-methyltransferase
VNAALDKAAISRSFSAAAGAYDGWASAQDEIAEALVRRLPEGASAGRIVELGCGTGLLAARLLRRFPEATLLGLDLAEGMIGACRRGFASEPRARFVLADAEDPAACRLTPQLCAVDLVAASCSAQWFADPAGTFRRWAATLAPGGLLAVALLVRGSYAELDAAHREALGTPFQGLPFPREDEALAAASPPGVVPLVVEATSVAVRYPSARAALGSFRGIGAVLRDQPGRAVLGAGRMRRLLAAYEARSGGGGALVTHRVLHVVARWAP